MTANHRRAARRFATALLVVSFAAARAAYPEYTVKAALLVELARFVTWPEESLGPVDGPFVVGTLGRDPMPSELGALVRERTVHGRRVEVRALASSAEVVTCHAVWIASTEREDLALLLARTEGRPILTLSDGEGFLDRGVHLVLVEKDGKIGFEVNLAAAERSHLRLGTDVLRLAARVEGGG